MANLKISISFKEKYEPVYIYLQQLKKKKENVSDYICKLVEQDMNQDSNDKSAEEIRKIIYEILQTNNLTLINSITASPSTFEQKLSDEDIKFLNRLF